MNINDEELISLQKQRLQQEIHKERVREANNRFRFYALLAFFILAVVFYWTPRVNHVIMHVPDFANCLVANDQKACNAFFAEPERWGR